MKTDSLKLAKVFSSGGDVLYLLPHFQREYAWEQDNWDILLKDIESIYDEYAVGSEPEHFMGSLVVINDGTRSGTIPAFKLVDGQQRLTTLSLILCALRQLCLEKTPALAKKIDKLLMNLDESGDYRYKLLPTKKYGDRDAYLALLNDVLLAGPVESKIPAAFRFIHKRLSASLEAGQLEPEKLFVVLSTCLQVVFIELEQRDRIYEIFESLNAKGKQLSQADLVRNYIAMRLPSAKQEDAFELYWSRIEGLLQEKRTVGRSRLGELTAFLRHYLAMRTGKLCNEEHVYARFRDRSHQEFAVTDQFVDELATLRRYAEHYDRLLRPEQEPRLEVRQAVTRLNVLEISTGAPFLLAAYDAVHREDLALADFLEGLAVLENYLVRRLLADEPTNYLNKMFPTLWREIDLKEFAPSLRRALATKKYPSDPRLKQALLTEDLYDKRSETRRKVSLVLETINRHISSGSGGFTLLDGNPTIEHIMPQQEPNSDWKRELGDNWNQVHETQLHTLGNLTIVTQEWNSALSNSAFAIKKSKLSTHALRLNSDYFSGPIKRWDERAIQARADYLYQHILQIWPALGGDLATPVANARPAVFTILGDIHAVKSWRDVAFHTVEALIAVSDDFPHLAKDFPSYLSESKFDGACRQLSNGWWLYVNLSAEAAKRFCRRLLAAAKISEDNWNVEEA
ncbi:MAG: DUF262 domain-containing protein [Chloroflexi bacterium]|nr:DUF262 domain-containing protein [Chloroflexota bacterium]